MGVARITESFLSRDEAMRPSVKANTLGQVLRVMLLAVLAALGIGFSALPRTGQAASANAHQFAHRPG